MNTLSTGHDDGQPRNSTRKAARLNIWLVNVGEETPLDPGQPRLLRTGILAGELARRGHQVTWWNSSVNHQRKIQRTNETTVIDTCQGYRLIFLHGRLYNSNRSALRVLNHFEIARSFQREVQNHPKPDVIVCGYPTIELADTVTAYAEEHRIPIAVDFRDLWPEAIADHLSPPVRFVLSPLIGYWARALRRIVQRASRIIGVTDSYVDWALGKAGRPRQPEDRAFHLTINPTAPSEANLAKARTFWDEAGIPESGPKLIGCFMGVLTQPHDLLAVVTASAQLNPALRERLQLVFCGPETLMTKIRAVAPDAPHITPAGWRDAGELHVLLQRSSFGLLPYPSISNYALNLPNKVSEYLSAGLPIMTGLTGEIRRLLTPEGLGFFYKEQDLESINACFVRLLSDPDQYAELKLRAVALYDREFNAKKLYSDFADYVENLKT